VRACVRACVCVCVCVRYVIRGIDFFVLLPNAQDLAIM